MVAIIGAMVVEALVAALVMSVISSVAAQAAEGNSLVSDLGRAVGKAGGAKASGVVTKYLQATERRKAIEAALFGALEAVEASHADFVNWSGGFDRGFLEHEASPELAKVFVVGDEPDPMTIASEWASYLSTAISRELVAKSFREAVPASQTLVQEWERLISRTPLFAATVRDRDARRRTESLDRIVKAVGATPAGSVPVLDQVRPKASGGPCAHARPRAPAFRTHGHLTRSARRPIASAEVPI